MLMGLAGLTGLTTWLTGRWRGAGLASDRALAEDAECLPFVQAYASDQARAYYNKTHNIVMYVL